jgi:hypothetical protein
MNIHITGIGPNGFINNYKISFIYKKNRTPMGIFDRNATKGDFRLKRSP